MLKLLVAAFLILPACAAAYAVPSGTPQLLTVSPSTVEPQTDDEIEITGKFTSFRQGASTVSFGSGITVNSVTVINATVLLADITVASTASTGNRNITVKTGGEDVMLNGKFSVLSGTPTTIPNRPNKGLGRKTYNVKMFLDVEANPKGKDILDMTWNMTGKLWLVPDPNNATQNTSSYVPEFKPGSNLAVTVEHWLMQGADGTPAVLTSAMSFNTPVGTPTLDLWDANPILTIPFAQPIPKETIEVKGHSTQISMFGSILMTVVSTNVITLPQVEALTGNTSNGVSPTSSKTAMQQAAANIQSHKGDVAWMMSAEGQAAIAALQKQAMATVSIPASQAATPAQMMATFQSVRLPWNNKSGMTVNKTFHFKKDDMKIDLTVVVYKVAE